MMLNELYRIIGEIEEECKDKEIYEFFHFIEYNELCKYYEDIQDIYLDINYTFNEETKQMNSIDKEDVALEILLNGIRGFIKINRRVY